MARRRSSKSLSLGTLAQVGMIVLVLFGCIGLFGRGAGAGAPPPAPEQLAEASPAARATADATPTTEPPVPTQTTRPVESPSPVPTIAPPAGEAIVTANLRSEPRIALDTVIGKLCTGDKLDYLTLQQVGSLKGAEVWYRVRVAAVGPACSAAQVAVGDEGWVASSVVSTPSGDVRQYALMRNGMVPTAIIVAVPSPTARRQTLAPQPATRRIGAICRDGTRSSATGRGACSHHGGVSSWLYGP